MIDRITPTFRPNQSARGYQRWRSLLFLHWPVPVETLQPLLPSGLEVDHYDGVAYVGVVPFAMEGVRNAWWPKWAAMTFLETNVRTYVYHGSQPGVYFLSLDAANRLAVWGARWFWGLPYYHAEMSLVRTGNEIAYETSRPGGNARHHVQYRIGPELGPSQPGTLEHFFLERYLLFLEHRGALYSGQVHHVPYPAHDVELMEIEDSLANASGLMIPPGPPAFAHFSPGVDVEVFGLRPLNRGS
ncbi:YqjF family protein [Bremerella sp.]|uniref:YqjF family protein n=1 Tax=Bremerella sp. TaxID=2795602 RepID=UPI003919F3DE